MLLSYRLPREPSAPRIAVWRKLKRLGVAQLSDGLVALPADARTREHLDWIADEVTDAGGAAMIWLARTTSLTHERHLAAQMAAARAAEYTELIEQASQATRTEAGSAARAAAIRRLRGQLRRITQRDYFPPPQRDAAKAAVQALTDRGSNEPAEQHHVQ